MSNPFLKKSALPMIVAGAAVFAAVGPAHALDKFKVTSVDCEMFWLWKHTPVIHYDIVDERRADYNVNPDGEYFRAAAARTAEYCDRTSAKAESPMNPPRKIRGVWFQSNDGRFKILFDLDRGGVDVSAGVTNLIGDRYAVDQRAAAQHAAQLEEIATREARAREVKRPKRRPRRTRSSPRTPARGFSSTIRPCRSPVSEPR